MMKLLPFVNWTSPNSSCQHSSNGVPCYVRWCNDWDQVWCHVRRVVVALLAHRSLPAVGQVGCSPLTSKLDAGCPSTTSRLCGAAAALMMTSWVAVVVVPQATIGWRLLPARGLADATLFLAGQARCCASDCCIVRWLVGAGRVW